MSTATAIAPLHRTDVQALYDAGDEKVIEALEDCLSILGDLFRRHSGSMFDVQFMDEGLALRVFHESLQALRDVDPLWQRMVTNLQVYLALKARAESEGPTGSVRASAIAAGMCSVNSGRSSLNIPRCCAPPNPCHNRSFNRPSVERSAPCDAKAPAVTSTAGAFL